MLRPDAFFPRYLEEFVLNESVMQAGI